MDRAPDSRPDPQSSGGLPRAGTMARRARIPLLASMGMVAAVAIAVPLHLDLPSLSAVGLVLLSVLGIVLFSIDRTPERFRLASHGMYAIALGAVAYAVFGLGIATPITVYFPAMVLLGAAHILGTRAALAWSVPSVALVAAGVYLAPTEERFVDSTVMLGVRLATLLTILAFGISFRRSHDRQAAELERHATTDPLTGLANRRAFEPALAQAIERSHRFGRRGALVFIDLDGVKQINDELGHAAGDELLRTTGARLASHTRSIDTPARLGGDEFVVLVSEFDDPKGGTVVARKLLAALSEPILLAGVQVQPSASLGVAVFPEAGDRPEALVRLADAAMYEAKRAGGGRIFLHDPSGLQEVE